MNIKSALLLLLFLSFIPCMALAEEEPTIYVIKQGDTLWGLSDRFIKDPNYWPKMWSRNDQITNPHLIYPGQKVRIFPDRMEFVPKEQSGGQKASGQSATAGAAVTAGTLTEVANERSYKVRGSEGYILDTAINPVGTIIGIHSNRTIAGVDDIVYTNIGRAKGAKGGEKFSAYRKDINISHPATNEIIGTKIVPLGTIQLTDLEEKTSRAIVTRTSQEIVPGAYLLPYSNDKRREINIKMPASDLKGYILASSSSIGIIAMGDIVYIDLGSTKGAEPGNMLYVVRDVTLDQRFTGGTSNKLPQELLGAIVILETRAKTATALVVKSIDTIYKGDRIISVTK